MTLDNEGSVRNKKYSIESEQVQYKTTMTNKRYQKEKSENDCGYIKTCQQNI